MSHNNCLKENDAEEDSDGISQDLDEDGDLELRLARLEHLLERRPILVRKKTQ